jgi:hypothetical protein
MAKVKSNHDVSLQFPIVGVTLNPGATIEIPNWDVVKNSDTVAAWLGAKVIELVDEKAPSKKTTASKG